MPPACREFFFVSKLADYTQSYTHRTCNRPGRKCYDRQCSIECRKRWAKRESWVLCDQLRQYKRDGSRVYFGTINFGIRLPPKQARGIVKEFHDRISTIGKWRWYLEPTPTDSRKVHVHFVLISDAGSEAVADSVKRFWSEAMGPLYDRSRSRAVCTRAFSIKRVSRYITGCTKDKASRPLIRRGLGIRTCGGSLRFFPASVEDRHRELTRHHKAWQLAKQDGDILDHPTIDHYLAVADASYAASRQPVPSLQDGYILDWLASQAPAVDGSEGVRYLIQDNSHPTAPETAPANPTADPVNPAAVAGESSFDALWHRPINPDAPSLPAGWIESPANGLAATESDEPADVRPHGPSP
jgi:hypothetical protein